MLVAIILLFASVDYGLSANSTCSGFRSCQECVTDLTCYWCTDSETCYDYDAVHVSSYFKHCGWGQARWRHCWLNVMALVIASCVIAFVILIALIVVCCWCRRKCDQRAETRMAKEDVHVQRQEAERRERSEARRAERAARTSEIRQKYGILKEDD